MPKMTNREVIERFFSNPNSTNGKYIENHSGSLYITLDGKRLMNYGTCLVERHPDYCMIVNKTRYSNTTSKIQSWIGGELWSRFGGEWINKNTISVDNVQINTTYLNEAAKEKVEWAKCIKPVKLINYFDVWGNKKDGWEVNNLCEEKEMAFEIHENASDKEILQALKNVGFLKSTVRINMVTIEYLFDFGWEIHQKKDDMPLCRIEFIHNPVQA